MTTAPRPVSSSAAGPREHTTSNLRGAAAAVVRLARAPAAWLTAVVCLSTVIRAAIGSSSDGVWILPDEIVYAELAKSIAEGGRPTIRGLPSGSWELVYPTLIAPAWALFENQQHAYHAALAINAFVMSLAAIPGYLLARIFVSPRHAVVVAPTSSSMSLLRQPPPP